MNRNANVQSKCVVVLTVILFFFVLLLREAPRPHFKDDGKQPLSPATTVTSMESEQSPTQIHQQNETHNFMYFRCHDTYDDSCCGHPSELEALARSRPSNTVCAHEYHKPPELPYEVVFPPFQVLSRPPGTDSKISSLSFFEVQLSPAETRRGASSSSSYSSSYSSREGGREGRRCRCATTASALSRARTRSQ